MNPDCLEKWNEHINAVIQCRRCPRLVSWREEVAVSKRKAYRDWTYWGKPVPGFGDPEARLLIVGLAPGAHGSNRTGRMFTGDASGDFLYPALNRAGFANQPSASTVDDGLTLKDAYITAAARCAPPDNKPTKEELLNCQPYLITEIKLLKNLQGIVALGRIALDWTIAAYHQLGFDLSAITFGHNQYFPSQNGNPWVITSYHPSRQNTQTGRLTQPMFDQVWQQARDLLNIYS